MDRTSDLDKNEWHSYEEQKMGTFTFMLKNSSLVHAINTYAYNRTTGA